jgi:carbon monoxide dehydrogenase subunit G
MTTAIDTRIHISAPRPVVWNALTDWSRAHEWMPEASDMRQTSEPLEVGTVLAFRAQKSDRTSTVEALRPGELISLASDGPGVHAVYTYTLQDAADGTEVRLVADVETRGAMKLLGPTIRSSIAKADGGQLEALARVVTPAPND